MKAFVVIDNKSRDVLGILTKEKDAKSMLKKLGDERIQCGEVARFAYEAWTWAEVSKWIDSPDNMGLGKQSLGLVIGK